MDINEELLDFLYLSPTAFHAVDSARTMLDGAGFIYAVAVLHMLVLDDDRNAFYQFIRSHLTDDGIALICTMGDGEFEMKSDIDTAFLLQEREHESGRMMVAGTSCRMVSFAVFEQELRNNHLEIIEKGITASLPDFDSFMFSVVKKA